MTENEAPAELLEELEPESQPVASEFSPPAGAAPAPAHKQLYQFLWAGIAVFFGCLLPFHNLAQGWDPEVFQPELRGPIGMMTLGGSVTAFAALLVIGAQLYCIRFRKVMLGPLAIMVLICIWSWFTVAGGFSAAGIGGEDGAWFKLFYDADYFGDFFAHLGPGHLFTVAGSSYAVLVFLSALLGMGKKKSGDSSAAAKGGRSRSGRRR